MKGAGWEITLLTIPFAFPRICASLLSCVRLCDPRDCSSGPSVHGVSQAGILGRAVILFFRGSSRSSDGTRVSCVSCIAGRFFTHWAIREAPFVFPGNTKAVSFVKHSPDSRLRKYYILLSPLPNSRQVSGNQGLYFSQFTSLSPKSTMLCNM